MNFLYIFTIVYFKTITIILTLPILNYNTIPDNFLTITVKTTSKNYDTRVRDILDTWFKKLPNNIWFITDLDDDQISTLSGNHLIPTECGMEHKISDLVCKMEKELEVFTYQNSLWSCHFDDDNYVNIEKLVELLQTFNPSLPYFFGKRSIKNPLYINNFDLKYATGGAGFCISNGILSTIEKDIKYGRYLDVAFDNRLPDDMAFSYFLEYNYNFPLTVIDGFHSHLEMESSILNPDDEISFSFNDMDDTNQRVKIIIPDYCVFPNDKRFMRALHCLVEEKRRRKMEN
uniref:Fringe glycosyltransferase n=1 Tax=Strongyloides papillosus TaxID=174720 RepID=A0A0N5CG50_STREA